MRAVAIVALLVGCGARFTPVQPATVPDSPGAFDKAIAVLVSEGESIDTKDEAAGAIVTRWVELEQMGSNYQTRITITRAGASLVVGSQCQRRIKDPGPGMASSWEPCGERQPETQQERINRIAAALSR